MTRKYLQNGDVTRWHRCWSTDIDDDPVWVLVTDIENGRGYRLCGGERVLPDKYGQGGKYVRQEAGLWFQDGDVPLEDEIYQYDEHCGEHYCGYTTPPPEEWPDEICARVAQYQLTGEV